MSLLWSSTFPQFHVKGFPSDRYIEQVLLISRTTEQVVLQRALWCAAPTQTHLSMYWFCFGCTHRNDAGWSMSDTQQKYLTDKMRIKIRIRTTQHFHSNQPLQLTVNVLGCSSVGFMKFVLLFSWLTTTGVLGRVVVVFFEKFPKKQAKF